MIGVREIVLTIFVSLVLLAGLAVWYTYEPTQSDTVQATATDEIAVAPNEQTDASDEDTEGRPSDSDVVTDSITIDPATMYDPTNPTATIQTNLGAITLELFASDMPITTDNFISLANDGFYDGTKFHRVISGFMIQGGDPNTRDEDSSRYGQGGPGFTIQDEFVSGDHLRNLPGTIAMANTGQPNSGGSQFFINVADNTNLDFDTPPMQSRHPVFGQVLEGMDVVAQIESVETGARDIPVEPVIVETITVQMN